MAEDSKVPVATLEYEPTSFEQSLLKHKSKLILVAVLAVVGTAGYFIWKNVKDSKHESAAVDFTRASTVDELKKVAANHEGQSAAGNALILAAEKLAAESKTTDAIATLKDFLSKNPEHPLRDLASWRMAEYLAASGDTAAAEKEYETVAQANSPYTGLALLRLGDLKWGAGDNAKAEEFYDRILGHPSLTNDPSRTVAKERKEKAIKIKPPTLIEYVAPLLPPPKLNAGGDGGSPGMPNIEGLPPDFQLPPGLQNVEIPDDPTPFSPRPVNDKPFDTPGLIDPPPAPAPPPSLPPGENKPAEDKKPADPAKSPNSGTQP